MVVAVPWPCEWVPIAAVTRPSSLHPHQRAFGGHWREHAGRGRLDIGADAKAEIAALLARRRLLGAERGDIELAQQLLHAFGGGDVGQLEAHGRGVRLVGPGDEVPPPQLDRIHAHLPRGHVDQHFARERFHRPGAAIGG